MPTIKRLFDVLVAAVAVVLLAVPVLVIAILVRSTSPGPALYWSKRIGARNRVFLMPKFRTMRLGTPVVATHLLDTPAAHLTPIGGTLRLLSLDELPQLWSILRGDMSFVGPRPALFNQLDLIAMRSARGVDTLTPGLTGWAQVNGRDELAIEVKVRYDEEYLARQSLAFDVQIMARTMVQAIAGRGVAH